MAQREPYGVRGQVTDVIPGTLGSSVSSGSRHGWVAVGCVLSKLSCGMCMLCYGTFSAGLLLSSHFTGEETVLAKLRKESGKAGILPLDLIDSGA